MDFPKVLLIRHFTEVLGMKYAGEGGEVLWFEEGLNRVAVGIYFTDLYEEAELYKRVGALMGLGASKVFLAVLPDALAFVDPRYFKANGVGLVVVDPAKGVDGVEVKIFARARPAAVEPLKIDAVKAALHEYLASELKRVEESLFEKVRRYVDQRVEEVKRALQAVEEAKRAAPPVQRAAAESAQEPRGGIGENEWVKILRSKR
ncbi:arcadin-2 [Pyrobaculum calidifontis]|uniref:Arcadin-2 n=1 Tax=Pyrobaculum calidifontis (strain DSM 21063 / JCM 11548 / VA1) TaxID=410359 RepID=RKD2_PYRCJ|nr:arcadin-2 [Pyrobaculum calidifontis]A3MWN6.1 RecName: Full=Arcadin-2 [Pyrobaculum calidifontis JCM 11548]ABO09053.1 actin-like protein [Pyrobaculum calidifontis JCM 11548]